MAASPSSPSSLGPAPEAEISIGSVLDGRYRIDALLGSGGMGRVYRGEHTGIGRAVAIKVLHADLNRNREAAQRFQREAIASGRLDHPNIVGVSDFGVIDEGPCYLVMEALEGESLGARLEREKRIPWREALEILRGVLAGLRHAHDRGVVHRDIKPDNIFLARKDGELIVKILDFGIAKLYAGNADDPASTRAGLTVGTPAYLSPEQAVGGEIKPASDLYSTTILLFEMITGRVPFEDKDPLAMLGAHVSREPPPIHDVAPDLAAEIPAALEDVIQRGLIKTSADRTSSAADYQALLDGVVGPSPNAPPHIRGTGGIPTPSAPSPQVTGEARVSSTAPTAAYQATPSLTTSGTPASGTMILLTERKQPEPALPVATRAISLAEAAPIPRNWIKLGAIIVAILAVLAIALALGSRGATSEVRPPAPAAPAAKTVAHPPSATVTKPAPRPAPAPATPAPPPAQPAVVVELPAPAASDADLQLKAALHDLDTGKTCLERKSAVAALLALGDTRAIKPLKAARFRMRGGVLGFNKRNDNACLKADAEAAIKKLAAGR